MSSEDDFLTPNGLYQNLRVYDVGRCIYAITYYFAHKFLKPGDRTIDQMVQAARSGVQNIVEGNVDGATSRETELKLTNVARGSMHELLSDYRDYLMLRQLEQWDVNSEKAKQTRRVCQQHNDPAYYQEAIKTRSDETIANIAITLISQFDVMIAGLMKHLKMEFLKHGGAREEMTHARLEYRRRQEQQRNPSYQGRQKQSDTSDKSDQIR